MVLCPGTESIVRAQQTEAAGGAIDGLDRVRATIPRIRRALSEGHAKAPTFRALITELQQSDVVVYVEPGACDSGARACLTFVRKTGSVRLLRATVSLEQIQVALIADIGHELRHAVEIAGAPEIVDQATLKRFYQQRTGEKCFPRRGVETPDAQRARTAVWTELQSDPDGAGRAPQAAGTRSQRP